jgi:demethylmenaquinone methyltransferase/2-methoxy-6-polyprenyl-1,4-benzoquinol methylase
MFSSIAPKYDLMNDIMTGFTHRCTRKFALNLLDLKDYERLIDLASGTGDFALLVNSLMTNNEIIAVDFSKGMLHQAIQKSQLRFKNRSDKGIHFLASDISYLPFLDESIDVCSICYGIRNVQDPLLVLKEIDRITSKRLLIIESTVPANPLIRLILSFYFKKIVPLLAKIFSSDAKAYDYYFESVEHFLPPLELIKLLKKTNWKIVTQQQLFLGAVTVYLASK